LPPFARVRAGNAHVDDKAEIGVVDGPRSATGRDLDHGRTIAFQVEEHRDIHGVGVGREPQRIGVHQLIEDDGVMGRRGPSLDVAAAHRFERGGRDEVEKDLHAAEEVEVVVGQPRRLLRRHAIHEFECPDAGFHRIGRHDLLGNLLVEARSLILRVRAGDGQCNGDQERPV